jgi:hypothetical protein
MHLLEGAKSIVASNRPTSSAWNNTGANGMTRTVASESLFDAFLALSRIRNITATCKNLPRQSKRLSCDWRMLSVPQ